MHLWAMGKTSPRQLHYNPVFSSFAYRLWLPPWVGSGFVATRVKRTKILNRPPLPNRVAYVIVRSRGYQFLSREVSLALSLKEDHLFDKAMNGLFDYQCLRAITEVNQCPVQINSTEEANIAKDWLLEKGHITPDGEENLRVVLFNKPDWRAHFKRRMAQF